MNKFILSEISVARRIFTTWFARAEIVTQSLYF